MRKSNDTAKTRELTEAELADVSGGRVNHQDFNIVHIVGPKPTDVASYSFGASQAGAF